MSPDITVIVTFYNREQYLKQCLESLRNQTYVGFKALLLDDGSTDRSLQIANEFATIDSRFIVSSTSHIGFPLTKNRGLDMVITPYLIFLDSDDVVHVDWLQQLHTAALITQADITACTYRKFTNAQSRALQQWQHLSTTLSFTDCSQDKMLLLLDPRCKTYMWNKLFKSELFTDLRFEDVIALSDLRLCGILFERAKRIVFIDNPLVFYRQHDTSMCTTTRDHSFDYWNYRFDSFIQLYTPLWNSYPETKCRIQSILKFELKLAAQWLTPTEVQNLAQKPFIKMATTSTLKGDI